MVGRRRIAPPAHRPLDTTRAQQRRRQLLQIAARHFAIHSFDEVSLDALADEAGVSHGLIYQYFGSKLGLYEAALTDAVATLNAAMAAELDLPPRDAVRAALRDFIGIASDNEEVWRLTIRGALGEARLQQIVENGRRDAISMFLAALAIERPNAGLRLGLRAWIGMIEAGVDSWLQHRKPEIAVVVEILAGALDAVLTSCGYEPLPPGRSDPRSVRPMR
jgi:AcrR family transcriptional regulator